MEIVHLLQQLTCTSQFDDREIREQDLNKIVTAASWTPSLADVQPWEIICIRSKDRKQAVLGTVLDSLMRPNMDSEIRSGWIAKAPVLLIVCLDGMRARARYGQIGEKILGLLDCGAAIQNMRLQALELGVKGCLIREFDREKCMKC